jgi:hypothetical protein
MRIKAWHFSFALLLSLTMAGPGTCQTNTTTDEERTAYCQGNETQRLAFEWTISGDFIEHDPDADRFKEAFETALQKSDVLYRWGCDHYSFPENGVRVHLVSTQIKDEQGEILGTAIVAVASSRSPKDPLSEIPIDTTHWFVPHYSPVEPIVREYFTRLRSKIWWMPSGKP